MAVGLALVLGLGAPAPSPAEQAASTATTAAGGEAAARDAEAWRENYAYTLGVQAYVFGFPYINNDFTGEITKVTISTEAPGSRSKVGGAKGEASLQMLPR